MNYTYYRRYQPSRRRSSFKSFFWLVVILVFFFLLLRACVSVISSISEEKKDEAVLSVYQGSAEILEWGQSEPHAASDAELVLEGDQVNTGEGSYVTLSFYNDTTLYLDQNTKLTFSDYSETEGQLTVVLELLDGQVWVSQPVQEQPLDILVRTDVMNANSIQGEYLISNQANAELLAVKSGQVDVDFVDRGMEDIVIETATMSENEQVAFDDEKERALLNRENVTLVEPVSEGQWSGTFISWATGEDLPETGESTEEEKTEEEPEEESTTEEVIESVETLTIQVNSPASGSTITKDAIAIEGKIVSGTASTVTVTWSGTDQPYTLSGYTPGSASFRYVADVDYANYALGQNIYTIVAYDENGKPSNTVTVILNAEF